MLGVDITVMVQVFPHMAAIWGLGMADGNGDCSNLSGVKYITYRAQFTVVVVYHCDQTAVGDREIRPHYGDGRPFGNSS